jgi:heterodisulfide reductase subunit A
VTLVINEATLPGTPLALKCRRLVIPEQIRPLSETGSIAHTLGQAMDVEGFIQSANVRHRPAASPRRGIFFVGPCHDEVDQEDIKFEIHWITAALTLLLKGDPALDQVAEIDKGLCARCLTCLRACPHGAVVLRDGFQPWIAAQACFGCGICVSSCPARAITSKSQDPAAQSTAAQTVVFACERSAGLAAQAAGLASTGADNPLEIRTVPCAGRLDQVTLVQPLIDGAQNVIVAGCHEGNCRSMTGSKTAATRVRQMTAIDMDPATAISYYGIAANEPQKLVQILGKSGSQKEESHA